MRYGYGGGLVFTAVVLGVDRGAVGVTLVNCKGVNGRLRGITLDHKRRVIYVVSVGGRRSFRSRTFGSTSITVRFAGPAITCDGCVGTFGTKIGLMSNDAK